MANSSCSSRLVRVAAAVLWTASPVLGAGGKPRNTVLFLGDSLTLGLGVDDDQAYPALVGKRWKKDGKPWVARTFAVLGGRTSDIRDSMDFTLADEDIALVFISIGGNDGIDLVAPGKVRANLEKIIETVQARKIPVILAAMKADPAKDPAYALEFDRIFPELAAKHGVELVPFLLGGIVKNPRLTVDRLHPNGAGQRIIAERVYAFMKKARLPDPPPKKNP